MSAQPTIQIDESTRSNILFDLRDIFNIQDPLEEQHKRYELWRAAHPQWAKIVDQIQGELVKLLGVGVAELDEEKTTSQ